MTETRKRIAIFTWGVADGAMAAIAAGLASGFAELGCDLDVVRISSDPPRDDLAFPVDVRHFCLNTRSSRSFVRLARYLRTNRPDVLICLGWMQNAPGIMARVLSRYRGLLLLNEQATLTYKARVEHRSDPMLSRMAWFARRFYDRADAVVAVSTSVLVDLESLGIPRSLPLLAIPNPIDQPRVRRLARAPSDVVESQKRDGPLVVSVGRLARQKNQRLLIGAFAQYRRASGIGTLVIAGEGPMRGQLEDMIQRSGLAAHVHLVGLVENPYPLIAAADAFVLSSEEEGFGLVLGEAMAIGTPIVATDCPGGVAEVLDGGNAGVLVRSNDEAALSQAMADVVADSALRARIVEHGLEHVQRYAPRAVASEWLELIDRLSVEKTREPG